MEAYQRQGCVSSRAVYQDGLSQCWLYGEETWQKLNPKILSPIGKRIVSSDPDLNGPTLVLLLQLQDNKIKKIPVDMSEDGPSDISVALISACIHINVNATMAELVARISAILRQPFLETAITLRNIENNFGLYYYEPDGLSKKYLRWYPKRADLNLPGDFDRLPSLPDEWHLIHMGSLTDRGYLCYSYAS